MTENIFEDFNYCRDCGSMWIDCCCADLNNIWGKDRAKPNEPGPRLMLAGYENMEEQLEKELNALIRQHHQQSMILAEMADHVGNMGNHQKQKELLREALEHEMIVIEHYETKFDLEPTRSQVYKSAFYLAKELNEIEIAKEVADKLFKGNPIEAIAEEIKNELTKI